MAKRFTDTDKWDRPWFRNLAMQYKLLWFFILDRCDIAGVWYVDMELAAFQIGFKFNRQKSEEAFEKQIEIKGERWLVKDFIPFQYGSLDESNKVYRSVSAKLLAFKEGALEGHKSPIQGGKDKDKEKDTVKDKEKEEGGVGEETKPLPLTDIQKIVTCYKMVSGYPKDDKAWDKLNFARCSKSAKQLLEFMGNWKDAADCIEDVYEKFTAKGLTVTIETAVKHASEWKMDKSEKLERV